MLDTLKQYGITPENALNPESVSKLHLIYEEKVAKLTKVKESVDSSKEQAQIASEVEKFSKNENLTMLAEHVSLEVSTILHRAFQLAPEVSYLLVDKFNELNKEIRSERDYLRATQTKSTVRIPKNWTQQKEECERIRDLTKSLYKLVTDMGGEVSLPMVDAKRGEGKSIQFSMLPRDPEETTTTKNHVSKRVVLTVDGTEYDQHLIRTCHDVIGCTVQDFMAQTNNGKVGVEHSVNGHTITVEVK